MATSIYKFEEGRLLIHESRALENDYIGSGVPLRIGGIRTIDKVLSVDTNYAKYGLLTPLSEVRTSGSQIFLVMRRGDLGTTNILSGGSVVMGGASSGAVKTGGIFMSGMAAMGVVSGILSGAEFLAEVVSGRSMSGAITVTAVVLGY